MTRDAVTRPSATPCAGLGSSSYRRSPLGRVCSVFKTYPGEVVP